MITGKTIRFTSLVVAAVAGLLMTVPGSAEIRSRSKELLIVQPRDLPEQAQVHGNALFLYSDDAGSTYLYVEQQRGGSLAVFDVTDPGRIKFMSSTSLDGAGAFDFVQPLDGHGELIRFRDHKGLAVLDLHKAGSPTLHGINALGASGETESLGETGLLMVNEPYNAIRVTARDYQVIDTSSPTDPVLLATVAQVTHKVVNRDTGTTFLLGSDGLTVIRRTIVERDYKAHLNSN
jgi:hypothetical protein